jgi:hypothetical protein
VFKYSASGNLKEVEIVLEMMKERGSSGKIGILSEKMIESQIEVVKEEI